MDYDTILLEKVLPKAFEETDVITNIQKESFENFIHHRLQTIIDEEPYLDVELEKNGRIRVSFSQVYVDNPYIVDEKRQIKYITPNEARLRELTYASTISVDVHVEEFSGYELISEKILPKVSIAKIPMMIGTSKCNLYHKTKDEKNMLGECEYDDGGYFIIKGKERVLISQERGNLNTIYVFQHKPSSKFKYSAEIRSTSEENGHSILLQMRLYSNNRVTVVLPFFSQEIPLAHIFLVFGYSIQEIDDLFQTICGVENENINLIRKRLLREMEITHSTEVAITSISQYILQSIIKESRSQYVIQILNNDILPHLGITSSPISKTFFLMFMLHKLIQTANGNRPEDDRDHLNNKRFETAGYLVSELFRALYKRFVRMIEPQVQKKHDVSTIINRTSIITQGMKTCFATGNWGIPKSNYIRCGVSQILSRLSFNATISHLRRILIPIGKEGKNSKIRQIHCSQYGFICPSETPEGHSSGIVKNFTLFTRVSTRIDTSHIQNLLEDYFTTDEIQRDNVQRHNTQSNYLFVNGRHIGIVSLPPNEFISRFRQLRSNHIIPYSVTLSHDSLLHTFHIHSDDGRILRPLWNLQDYTFREIEQVIQTETWESLLEKEYIIYLDSNEIEHAYISMRPNDITPKHDYLEIHPIMMFGICVNLIPYVDHIQAPRITYQGAMGKQAIGMYATNNDIRCDTVVHSLQYPEKPIVQTHLSELLNYSNLPSGNNLIVAIACYGGYNQEDSVIFNQSSIDRGVFRCFTYRTILIEEKKRNNNSHEIIELPNESIRNSLYNYEKLDSRGIITVGSYIGPNDVIVGRTVSTQKKGISQKSDNSVVIRNGEEGYVDRLFESTTPDGYLMVKVKIRFLRIPEIGDKTASRSAQKGTIGMVFRHADMPFTQEGIVPDIIINPQCIPSRMTINQLLECIAAKNAVIDGQFVYSTPFSKYSHDIVDELMDKLHKNGYEKYGNEVMFNGFTGEPFQSRIFIGPTYYQRLKHLVASKIHARDHGSVQSLVRQPLEGRSKEGGLRFGEMEKDCMISHGVSRFLNERLYDLSDKFQIIVCKNCGSIPNQTDRCYECDQDDIHPVNLPYACKLLFQELMAIGIKIHFKLKN